MEDAPGKPGVFINYRRRDTEFPAGWLYNLLAAHFGKMQIFKDVDSILPGEDFVEVITGAVRACHTILVVIGPNWLDADNNLHRANDFVRLEIEAALDNGLRIIPILIGDTPIPNAQELPESISALTRRNAIRLSPNHFDDDVARLIPIIEEARRDAERRAAEAARRAAEAAAHRAAERAEQARDQAEGRRGGGVASAPDEPALSVPRDPRRLRRIVGPASLLFISLGSIIGSGWLLGPYTAARAAGPASLISWPIAGVIFILLALVHAELGAAYPLTGGTARFPRLAFGSIAGFTAGWVSWLQGVTIAPIEVEAALSYLDHLTPGLIDENGALIGNGFTVAIALMGVFTLINVLGVNWLASTNKALMIWKLAVPAILTVVLIGLLFRGSNFVAGGGFAPYGAHGVLAALPLGVVFALQGFEQAVQMAGEVRNPQRDLPRAVIGSVVIGTAFYLVSEVAFIGSLNPANLVNGWSNPIGEGDFGPFGTLTSTLDNTLRTAGLAGLGWLVVVIYIDAFISPVGTGLIYMGTTARTSYALGRTGLAPKSLSTLSTRGVPWTSVILAFIVGLICFLPFPSWQGLVGLVTSATVIMYGFGPITLVALRKADPDRPRPYRLPAATFLSVLAFIAANEIIYWTGWDTDSKLLIGVLVGYVIFGLSYAFRRTTEKPPLDPVALAWMLPWFVGLAVISLLGQYGDGLGVLPEWVDLLVVALFSVVIFFLGVRMALPEARVQALFRQDEAEAAADPVLAEG